MNIYETLADKIESRILAGSINAGEKLPSVRELSLKEEVSPSTVVQAYELLLSRGLIETRPRSGFFVLRVASPRINQSKKTSSFIPQSHLNPDELIKALRLAVHDPKIFPFGAASPLPDYYPTKTLNRLIQKVLRNEPALMSEYRFPPGSPELRELIAERYSRFGLKVSGDDIVTTAGAIESISLTLKTIANPGDVIAVETPCYFGILQLVRSMKYKVLEIPIDPEKGLLPEKFEEAIKKCSDIKALVTIPNFSNPLGSLMPDENKERIVQLAEKANIVLIEDDIYGDLYFQDHRPRPLKAFDRKDTVVTCGSFAKTVSPAFRVGYVISKKFASDIMFHRTAFTSGVTALGEEVLTTFLDSDYLEKHLRFLRSSYKTLIAQYSHAVLSHFPEGTKISHPQGGFVLWIQLPQKFDMRDVQKVALEHSISIAPGTIFSASNKDYVNYMRLNCAIPMNQHSMKNLQKLTKVIKSQVF